MDAEQFKREVSTIESGTLVELLLSEGAAESLSNYRPLRMAAYFVKGQEAVSSYRYAACIARHKDEEGKLYDIWMLFNDDVLEMRVLGSTPAPAQRSS